MQKVDPPVAKTTVSFVLNGSSVHVSDATPLLSLNDWLRAQPGLAGTKRMCEEGGCGCCVVAGVGPIQSAEEEPENNTAAINSVRLDRQYMQSAKLH